MTLPLGTRFAPEPGMDLYEVRAEGCHTPLSSQQITELFEGGQFHRHLPCRPLGKTTWRTIDELFPLLKYSQRAPSFEVDDPTGPRRVWPISVASVVLVIAVLGGAFYVWNRHVSSDTAGLPPQTILPVVARMTPSPRSEPRPFSSALAPYRNPDAERLLTEQRQREQSAREQAAIADQMRAKAQRERQEAERAAGTDYHVPLDQDFLIRDPSGLSARVRVHDNDVTSFDIWVNGAHYRQIRKQKGITHSGTDETFVYRSGRSSLFYVWEIAGELDHCLLRLREK